MSPLSDLVQLAQGAIVLALWVSLPVLVVSALIGTFMGTLQTAFQVHDPSIGHLPRLLAVAGTLMVAGDWMGNQIVAFARHALGLS